MSQALAVGQHLVLRVLHRRLLERLEGLWMESIIGSSSRVVLGGKVRLFTKLGPAQFGPK